MMTSARCQEKSGNNLSETDARRNKEIFQLFWVISQVYFAIAAKYILERPARNIHKEVFYILIW